MRSAAPCSVTRTNQAVRTSPGGGRAPIGHGAGAPTASRASRWGDGQCDAGKGLFQVDTLDLRIAVGSQAEEQVLEARQAGSTVALKGNLGIQTAPAVQAPPEGKEGGVMDQLNSGYLPLGLFALAVGGLQVCWISNTPAD